MVCVLIVVFFQLPLSERESLIVVINLLNSFILIMANINHEVDVCSQCKTAINDDLFLCVCCGVTMHLSKKCTGFADDTIKGIIEGGLNILLVCNQCVFTKRRDAMISRIHSQPQEGKIEKVIEEVNNFKSAVMEKLDLIMMQCSLR